MKILIPYGNFYPSQVGGPANTLYWHCCALNEKGINTTVISTMSGISTGVVISDRFIDTDDCGRILYSSRGIYSLKTLKRLSREISGNDIIHLNSLFSPFSIYSFFYKKLFHPTKKIVWSVRGELSKNALELSSWKKKPLLYLYKKLNKKVVYHSTSEQETENIEWMFPGAKVVEIPNLIKPPERINRKEKSNLLFLGRLHPIKGLDKLIKSLPLSKVFMESKTKLFITGKHEPRHDDYIQKLNGLIEELNLTDRVIFKGHMEGNKKEEIYARSYALILPSESENFGNVVVEALNQGTPVIASTGTPWSILERYNAGYHVSNDPKHLAAAIDKILSLNKKEYHQMSLNAKKVLDENFIVETQIMKWINVYKSVLDDK